MSNIEVGSATTELRQPLPTLAGIEDAARLLLHVTRETPLVRAVRLSQLFGREVLLKIETVTPIASFKLRGAYVDLARAVKTSPVRLAVTSSSGNHGQGVAQAAQLLGLSAHVFVPRSAIAAKAMAIEALGAELHRVDGDLYHAKQMARHFAEAEGGRFVDDGRSVDVMEGAGTIGMEIAARVSDPALIFVPVGDGALIGGIACAAKGSASALVIGCQAEGAQSLAASFRERRLIDLPAETIADGICGRQPTELALAAMLRWVDVMQIVSDREILSALRMLVEEGHVLAEPASAAALAAAWNSRFHYLDRTFVIVVTGANVARDMLQAALAAPDLRSL